MRGAIVRECKNCGAKNRIPPEHLADTGRCGKCKTELPPMGAPIEADRDSFEGIVSSVKVPVLVDFWATWCAPCRASAPGVRKLAESMAGRAVVLKVDTDKHPELASRYNVQGIPNFVVLKNGRVVSQQAGMARIEQMRDWLEQAQSAP